MKQARQLLYTYFINKFGLVSLVKNANAEKHNKDKLEAYGFIFGTKLYRKFLSGRFRTFSEVINATSSSDVKFEVNTKAHGLLLRHEIDVFPRS